MIYLLEDDDNIRKLVCYALLKEGFEVQGYSSPKEFHREMDTELPELILLDIMLPEEDGLSILNKLRNNAETEHIPVIMLTAKGSEFDKVTGLDMGADDYLPKPFAMGELLARVRAMLRRKENFTPDILKVGNLALNMQSYELSCNGQSFVLPKLEYQLIELLMLNKGIYLSTEDLLTKVWGYDTDAELGTVWVYISYLRKRLAALSSDVVIRAKRNVGYTLEVEE